MFGGFGAAKIIGGGLALAAVASLGVAAYVYVSGMQKTIIAQTSALERYEANESQLKQAIAAKDRAIAKHRAARETADRIAATLRQQAEQLDEELAASLRSLEALKQDPEAGAYIALPVPDPVRQRVRAEIDAARRAADLDGANRADLPAGRVPAATNGEAARSDGDGGSAESDQ